MNRPAIILADLFILAVLTSGCGHAGAELCRVAAIPIGVEASAASLQRAADRVEGECAVATHGEVTATMPAHLETLDLAAARELLAALREGEKLFYGEDPDAGIAHLVKTWQRLQANPQLLPMDQTARDFAYRTLLIVLRSLANESDKAPAPMYAWLALHMPEQVPSVRELPPKLAAGAHAAVEELRQHEASITLDGSASCPNGKLRLDARNIGGAPLSKRPVVAGRHAVVLDCEGTFSWVRRMDLVGDAVLEPPDLSLEPLVSLGRQGIALSPQASLEQLGQIGPRLAASLGFDGLVLVPEEETVNALLVTPTAGTELIPLGGRYYVTEKALGPSIGRTTAKWVLLGLSLLSLSSGLTANYVYNGKIDDMSDGLADNRHDARGWEYAGWACYAGAGTLLAASVVMFILDRPADQAEPLF